MDVSASRTSTLCGTIRAQAAHSLPSHGGRWAFACWLVAQRIAWPELTVYIAGVGLNLLMNLIFVFWLGFGFDGGGRAPQAPKYKV